METAGGQIGEPEKVELAISMFYPSVDDVGGGGDQPKNKCVCVIGSNVNRFPDLDGEEEGDCSIGMGRWWVQFFIAGGYSLSSIMDKASSGVALDFGSVSSDWTGIMAVHKPFKQVKMDVDHSSFTFVVAPDGSPTIFCLGGFVKEEGHREGGYLASRDVRIFDFKTATYTYGPSMQAPRVEPVVLVLDGKIYVFGGVTYDNPAVASWAEALDMITTNSNTDAHPWKLLHPPPVFPICHGTFALGVDEGENIFFSGEGGGKAILLGSTTEQIFLVYHVAEDRWIQLPDKIPIPFWSSWPVAVGHTLFWFGDNFYAYDLHTHQLSGGLVRGLGDELNIYIMGNEPEYSYKPGLHHLGGDDFCLIWLDWVDVVSCTFTRLHSTVIRVVMSKDDFSFLDAFVVASISQLLPQGFFLDCSLLLDGLVYNHTIVKEGLISESLIPEMIVQDNAEAGTDHEGAAKETIEDNADHKEVANEKIVDNADHEEAAKEKIEDNAGI